MPLYRDFSDDNATILVWKYDETEDLDIHKLLEPENAEKVKDYHPKKLLEVLMVRKLLKGLKPNSKILYKERYSLLLAKNYIYIFFKRLFSFFTIPPSYLPQLNLF